MPDRICPIPGCTKRVFSDGLCLDHARHACSVDRCTARAEIHGLCLDHALNPPDSVHTRANAVLTMQEVREIRDLWPASGMTQQEIANHYGVTRRTVHSVARHETWRHVQ